MSYHVTNIHLSAIVKLLEAIEDKIPPVRQQVAMQILQSFMNDSELTSALGRGLVKPEQIVKGAYEVADKFVAYGEQ